MKQSAIRAVFTGGIIAGILDLTYAILLYSPHAPIRIPQTIASGVLGAKSFDGGMSTAALGVVLHFTIALTAAVVYYLASRKLTILVDRALVSGVLYGAWVYVFMHAVVLPLSAVPHGHMPLILKVCEFLEHCIFVGPPIALSVRYFAAGDLCSKSSDRVVTAQEQQSM
jgi:uncharacterized membrane protein YagU involved in acid resistance